MTLELPSPTLLPAPPPVPADQRGRGTLTLRYEDILQDGRLQLRPMTHSIGAIWRGVLLAHPLASAFRADGVLPILSRLAVEGGGGPLSAHARVETDGRFALARALDPRGETRLRLDMWAALTGARSRTHGPPPPGAGEPLLVGRMLAEHVLTRPFGPPAARKVVDLPAGASSPLREDAWTPPHALAALPPDATPIDERWAADPAPVVFGSSHTDSNQHVNSLVYPQLVEQAALRRFAELGRPVDRYLRFMDVTFRKPCFVGDRVRVWLRAFEAGADLGVVAAVLPLEHAGEVPGERAHAYAQLRFA